MHLKWRTFMFSEYQLLTFPVLYPIYITNCYDFNTFSTFLEKIAHPINKASPRDKSVGIHIQLIPDIILSLPIIPPFANAPVITMLLNRRNNRITTTNETTMDTFILFKFIILYSLIVHFIKFYQVTLLPVTSLYIRIITAKKSSIWINPPNV